jgi:hypothetical protein
MRANAQKRYCVLAILVTTLEAYMLFTSRCNYAGPLAKRIPTRSFAAFLFARSVITRFRW